MPTGDHQLWPRPEPESRQHRQALRVHAQQAWLHDVDIIVHLDRRFAGDDPHHSTDVLHDAPLVSEWERKKERVERRAVEPLAEIAASSNEHHPGSWACISQAVCDGGPSLFPHSASENQALDATSLDSADD